MNGTVLSAALDLAQKIKAIPTLEAIILFGSAATGEMHKKSDVDLYLLFNADHDPEAGEEGKVVHRAAGEIEHSYKLENPFSFVFVNRGEAVNSEFLWEVAKDGIMLYCRPEKVLGTKEYLKPAVFISYTFGGILQKDKMYVGRKLYGYKARLTYKGKEYVIEREGLITQYGKRLGRGTFIIDARKSDDVIRLFNEKSVTYTITKVWV